MRDGFAYWMLMILVRRLPFMLVAAAGIVVAIIRWKIHPKVSLMTVIALIIYFIEIFTFNTFLYYLPNMLDPLRLSSSGTSWIYSIAYFCEDIVAAVIIILLVAAAFSGRPTSESISQTV